MQARMAALRAQIPAATWLDWSERVETSESPITVIAMPAQTGRRPKAPSPGGRAMVQPRKAAPEKRRSSQRTG